MISAKKSLVYAPNPEPLAGNVTTNPYALDNVSWNVTSTVTFSANSTLAPDGTMLADKVIPAANNVNSHHVSQTLLTSTAKDWILRCRAKPSGYQYLVLVIASDAVYTKYCQAIFDLGSFAVTPLVGATYIGRPSIKRLAGGWALCDLVCNVDANITHRVDIPIERDGGGRFAYPGDLVSGMFLWGAEFAPVPN